MVSKRPRRLLLISLILVAAALAAGVGGYFWFTQEPEMIRVALEWARMNPIPASAAGVDVDMKGSMFTREFVVQFTAPASDVDAWLLASPGTCSETPTRDGTVRKYSISPGGGAQFAEVRVDEESCRVTIRTYWS